MAQFYFTEQDRTAVERRIGQLARRYVDTPSRTAVTLPKLGKADADITKNSSGEFSLFANKPDTLEVSDSKQTAFALADFNKGDVGELKRYSGEASGGFWGALKLTGGTSTPLDTACVCDLIDTLQDATAISPSEADALRVTCGCPLDTPITSDCEGLTFPAQITVEFGKAGETQFEDFIIPVRPDPISGAPGPSHDVKMATLNGKKAVWSDIMQDGSFCDFSLKSGPTFRVITSEYQTGPGGIVTVPQTEHVYALAPLLISYNRPDEEWFTSITFQREAGTLGSLYVFPMYEKFECQENAGVGTPTMFANSPHEISFPQFGIVPAPVGSLVFA